VTLHATRFELAVADCYLVRLGDDDYGLYGRRYRNRFGTPLMARGTAVELAGLVGGRRLVDALGREA
jgi:hypothetical protein